MQIKCLLFIKQFFSPVKTITLDVPKDMSDDDIIARATKAFWQDFRVEIEDVRKPHHPPYNKSDLDTPVKIEQISPHRIRVNGKCYKKADIMKYHGMTASQYWYLRSIKKHSMAEIFKKGLDLHVRRREKLSS